MHDRLIVDLERVRNDVYHAVLRAKTFVLEDVAPTRVAGRYVEEGVEVTVTTYRWGWFWEKVEAYLYKGPYTLYVTSYHNVSVFKKVLEDVIQALESPQGRLWRFRLKDQEGWKNFLLTLRSSLDAVDRKPWTD